MGTLAYHRPARSYPEPVPQSDVVIAAPPSVPPPDSRFSGWLQTLLPLLMGAGSMGIVFFVPFGGWLFKAIFVGIALLSGMAAVVLRLSQTRGVRRSRAADRDRYLAYLEGHEIRLRQTAEAQRRAMARLHPDLPALTDLVADRRHVWERRRQDADFLMLRIGTGAQPLVSGIRLDLGTNPLTVYDPELLHVANSLVERYSALPEMATTVGFSRLGSTALLGPAATTRPLARAILAELAALHAPDDVSLMAFFPPEARAHWEWMKWLPHVRNHSIRTVEGAPPACLLADDPATFAWLLGGAVRPRLDQLRRRGARDEPPGMEFGHLVVLIDGYDPGAPIAQLPVLAELLPRAREAHVTVLCMVEARGREPSVVEVRIEAGSDHLLSFEETTASGRRFRDVVPAAAAVRDCETIARALAPLRLEERSAQREFAENVRLLDLLGLTSADAVNPAAEWLPRHRTELMRTPLGIRGDGDPVVLDLKEAASGGMGPHGLIVGATGSGKSELLRSMVTGLAVNHSPDLLNFVFVDFKGGAAFADLSHLPQVAGLITNLQSDLSRVDRMHDALIGEQGRRQQLLREAGNVDGIKEYQARRAGDRSMAPMPYLLIIVDEFGELLTSRPDFLDLFVAIGRVGRSLGMHLLLSTQRLDEGRIRGLEGHLRYRVCLRTFSAQESQTALGTPDAYHLPAYPGSGYFKVDTSIYVRFKAALISGPYLRAGAPAAQRATIAVFAGIAQADDIAMMTTPPPVGSEGDPGDHHPVTEMDRVIGHLVERGRSRSPAVHQVWLPPLEPRITLDAVIRLARRGSGDANLTRAFGALRVPVGMVDRPLQQAQDAFFLDFSGTGGHLSLAGAPQSGKSTLLRTLISALAVTHSPEDVQFYCIDLGGGSLHALESLPHVGTVCGKADRQKVRRVIREMQSIIEEREQLFRQHRLDSVAAFRRARERAELPADVRGDVFLVIDNWAQLRQEWEDIDGEIGSILTTGLGYGVHVVIATNRWADMRSSLRDNIGGRLELHLNDPIESDFGRAAALSLPSGIPGRGLTPDGLHFQTGLPRIDGNSDPASQSNGLDDLMARVTRSWRRRVPAPPVRMLPSLVTPAQLPPTRADGPPGVPLGIEEFRLEPVYADLFGSDPHFLILGDSEAGKTSTVRLWIEQLRRRYTPEEARVLLVDYRRTLIDAGEGPHILAYAATPNLAREAIENLRAQLTARLPAADIGREALINRTWWRGPEIVVFVDDYDLVASPAGNPLAPLVELLAQGRDVGFHLVLCRRVGGVSRSSFEPVFQRVKELGSPGLIMSGDPAEGVILGSHRATPLPPGRGSLVRRNQRTALVQIALIPPPP